MRKFITPAIACACLIATSAQAALVINDPGFNNDFTALGKNTFTQADSANFDKWVFEDDTRDWARPTAGGNTGGYADGAFPGNNYNRTMYQAVTDNKSTTGLNNMSFDLTLFDGNLTDGPLTVSVWGVETLGSTFTLSTRVQAGVTSGSAIILGTQQFSTNTNGWEEQLISNIDFGTGYDLVIIGFFGATYNQDAPENDVLGIDNVAIAPIPEPASLALMGLGGLLVLGGRQRRLQD